ncbi:MAG: LysR family transcriptional regulator [Ruminococcaceae bacterium]|nr:LysR family transcriptional regulator [Oscillospiraceae bacterium]
MEQKFRPVLTVRIFGQSKCFGPGVAELLRRVQEKHSLRSAAISMQMAYSKAWTVIKNAEKELGFELLVTTTGGKHGGGASLSAKAEAILAAYEEYRKNLQRYANEEFEKTLGALLNE